MRTRLTVGGVAALAAAAGAQQAGVVNTPSSPPPMMVTNSSPPQMQVMSAIGVPPAAALPPGACIVRPPELRSTVSSYITPDDYPASAHAAKQHGRVEFELIVGPNGRVAGCSITKSSGSAILDVTTCNLMRRRAHFTPAVDSNGNPATAPVRLSFTWKL